MKELSYLWRKLHMPIFISVQDASLFYVRLFCGFILEDAILYIGCVL